MQPTERLVHRAAAELAAGRAQPACLGLGGASRLRRPGQGACAAWHQGSSPCAHHTAAGTDIAQQAACRSTRSGVQHASSTRGYHQQSTPSHQAWARWVSTRKLWSESPLNRAASAYPAMTASKHATSRRVVKAPAQKADAGKDANKAVRTCHGLRDRRRQRRAASEGKQACRYYTLQVDCAGLSHWQQVRRRRRTCAQQP